MVNPRRIVDRRADSARLSSQGRAPRRTHAAAHSAPALGRAASHPLARQALRDLLPFTGGAVGAGSSRAASRGRLEQRALR
jgi:hypothetical protein